MKINVVLVLIMCVFFTSYSQSFEGKIVDKDTQKPISFAKIYFVDLNTGITADENGVFKLDHHAQKSIVISLPGYTTISETVNIDAVSEKIFYLEKTHYQLNEIVISESTGRLQEENSTHVEYRTVQELQQNSPATLAEAISDIPGVEQNTTGVGIGKPVIRGLSGNRIVTYVQGIRVENQQFGDEHGLGVGALGIERVEVIKGPASVLYGSDALGGVLYFIEERYAKINKITGFGQTQFLSNSLGSINNVGIKINKHKLKLNVFGSYSSHADYQVPNAERVFNTRFDEKNIKSAFGFNTNNWIVNLKYSYLQNNYAIAEEDSLGSSTERNFVLPFQSIDNHNISLENIFFTGASKLSLIVGYTNNYRREFEDDKDEPALGLTLNTFLYNLRWASPTYKDYLSFTVGVQGLSQNNENSGEEFLIPDAQVTDFGAFGLVNFNFNRLQLQAGLRSDTRLIDTKAIATPEQSISAFNNTYNGLTFSSGAVYNFKKSTLRINVSSGYRAPNTSELLSDGVHEGTNRYERGNMNLKEESATQIDFSFEHRGEHFSFALNPFYNTIKNYIFLSPTEIFIEENPVFDYLQTDASLYGGEVGFHYHPHAIHWLHFESNLSSVIAEDNNGNALPLIPQTKINSKIKAEVSQKGKFQLKTIFIQHIHKFEQNRISVFETRTPNYNLINIGLNFEILTKNAIIGIDMGIKNALNNDYIDHLSRFKKLEISNPGRNFYVGIKIKINDDA